MLRQAEEAYRERARAEPRALVHSSVAPGTGRLLLQIVESASFEGTRVWEVRQTFDGWQLQRPEVVQTWPEFWIVGCNPVPFDQATLADYHRRITSLTLPLAPDQSGMGGLDGTSHQLACFGDLFSQWRFQWWSTHPPQWQPLVDIANEMIEGFSAAG